MANGKGSIMSTAEDKLSGLGFSHAGAKGSAAIFTKAGVPGEFQIELPHGPGSPFAPAEGNGIGELPGYLKAESWITNDKLARS